jgi:pimeloyl-ACP methyl ester carboxylesterase
MFVDVDGYRFFTLDIGSGPRTFLAHSGWIGTIEDWLPTLGVLSKQWRVISYDHRGAGETVVPVDAITPDALIDDIFRVMDALQVERCILGGFSAGAGIALRAAVLHPERFDGLVLTNGSAGVRAPDAGPPPPRQPVSSWPGADHAARMRWFIERCTPEPDVEHIRRWGHHFLMRAEPEAAERLWGIMPPPDAELLDRVRRLALRTLIIHGSLDPFATLPAMEHLASLIPDSRLEVIEGVGHLPAMIRPHEVAALIGAFFR